ncbi:MAG: hypothetical protein B6242_08370 [Anaerolineaceae bacterium 4572_78]|nr:MAG: hypothetical protein B6242_08370 [Anaerolineaceae bacterium 4572_78]
MLKQKTWLGIFFDVIFNHMVAQWSEKASFFISKQVLTLKFILSNNNIEQSYMSNDMAGFYD